MSKRIIFKLSPIHISDFLYEILPAQAETVVGGDTIVDLSTIHDGVNNLSNTFPSLVGIDNNKLFTVDFSRLTINWIIMFPDEESLVFRWLI